MKKFTLVCLRSSLAILLLVTPALAMDGSSGCGAGWYIFKDNSLVSSSLRSTTNGIFSNNTFGMTFGTSNCQKHSIVQNEQESLYFAESNQEVLEVQLASGRGEYVDAFADTLGCADHAGFARVTRQGYGRIFPRSNVAPIDLLQNVKTEIRAHPALAAGCSRV